MRDDDEARLRVPVGPQDHAQGPDDAPVTLVEYGDYECPHCGRAYPIVQEVQRRLGDTLRFVYRNFPLSEAHPHAARAAEAAEAAGAQGRFWPMHDILFEHQRQLDDASLIGHAVTIGIDAERVRRELEAHTHRSRVRSDFSGGVRSGVNGTPTFFIDGVRYDDDWDADSLTDALRAAARRHQLKKRA
jgi:protein-disulfide isomerase